jgi:hypothetical protein
MKVISIAILIVTSTSGTFIGLYICSLLGLGFGFGDLKRDIARCLCLSLTVVLIGVGLYSIALTPRVLIVLPVLWFIGIKLAWIDLEKPEIAITGVATLVFTGFVIRLIAEGLSQFVPATQ